MSEIDEMLEGIAEEIRQKDRTIHKYRKTTAFLIRELVCEWKCPYGTADVPEKCKKDRVKSVEECENCWIEYCAGME